MDQDILELRIAVGKVAEATGRMLQRKPSLDLDELILLSETLDYLGDTVNAIKETIVIRNS